MEFNVQKIDVHDGGSDSNESLNSTSCCISCEKGSCGLLNGTEVIDLR